MTNSVPYRSYKSLPKWMLLTLVGLSFVFFGNSISNGFSLDDELVTSIDENVIHKNVDKGIWGIPDIFTSHYVENAEQEYGYRPVTTSSFALEKSIYSPDDFEARAHFSHFLNVLLYGLNAALVCIVLFKILPGNRRNLAFGVALLFLIHPIHSEVVNNIKCRDELLVFFFGMIAVISLWKYYHGPHKSSKWLVVGLFMVCLSALSKTNGVLFVVLIPLILYCFSDIKNNVLVKLLIGLIAFAALFVVISKAMVPESHIRELLYIENPLYVHNEWSHKLPMFFYCIAWYLKMLLFPYPLSYYYGYNQIPLADWSHIMVWIGLVFVLATTTLAIWRIRKKEIWAFGILFFMFAIGSLANLISISPGIVAERFAYLPSLGLTLMVGYYGAILFKKVGNEQKSKWVVGFLGLGVLFISVYNWNRNEVWESKFVLYKSDMSHLSNSAKAHSLLSQEYKKEADANRFNRKIYASFIDSTMNEINEGLNVYPEYANLWNNKGFISHKIHQELDSAIYCYSQAVHSFEKYDEAYFNLGIAYLDQLGGLDLLLSGLSLIGNDSLGDYGLDLINYEELEELSISEILINQGIDNVIKQNAQLVVEARYHPQLLVNVKNIVDNVLNTSNSIEIQEFPFEEHTYDRLSQALTSVNKESAAQVMQQYLTDVKQLFIYYNQSMFQNNYGITTAGEVNEIFSVLETKREEIVASIVSNFENAIKYGETKLHFYDRYALFLKEERRVSEFVELNERGINTESLKNKSQLYLNLILLYKFQEQYELGLKWLDAGFKYLEDQQKSGNRTEEEKKRLKNIKRSFNKLKEDLIEKSESGSIK